MIVRKKSTALWSIAAVLLLLLSYLPVVAQSDKDFPPKPVPPRLVNDLAGMMDAGQVSQLERKLEDFDKTTSTQITVVTIKNLGGYDIAQYAVELGNRWGVGRKGKDNGALILASLDDRKVNISTGYGLEGALTDATCGRIIRNEMRPAFKEGRYYEGFSKAADAIIAATKGEYTNDDKKDEKGIPAGVIVFIVIVILLAISRRGGGGGTYMSRRGYRGWHGAGWFGGLGGFGGGNWSGGGSRGGGFGGFGGGSFGGGGASGNW